MEKSTYMNVSFKCVKPVIKGTHIRIKLKSNNNKGLNLGKQCLRTIVKYLTILENVRKHFHTGRLAGLLF